MENTKRDLSLDFTKPRYPRGGLPAPSLVTPILNLSTPELNKMIPCGDELAVLTPNGISSIISQSNVLPSPLIPTTVNSNNIIQTACNTINNNSNISNNHSNNHQKRSDKIRDLDTDKIEKKRERNRLAAKKCRQRKLETIDELRKTVSDWEQKYARLEMDFERFKCMKSKEIDELQNKLAMQNSDCKFELNSLMRP